MVEEDQWDLLERELRARLSGELGDIAADAGLTPDRMLERADEKTGEILEPAADAWSSLEKARREERQLAQSLTFPGNLRNARVWLTPLAAVGVFMVVLTGLSVVLVPHGFLAFVVVAASLVAAFVAARLVRGAVRRSQEPARRLAAEKRGAAERLYAKNLQASVQAWVTEQVNAATGRSYGTVLDYANCSGLAEVDDSAREIPTQSRERLLRLMEQMPGGAIGLSGSRGAGKTTLMRSLCRPATDDGTDMLAVMVDAPVSYDARDFVLYLFARTCARVLGPERVARLRSGGGPLRSSPGSLSMLLATTESVIGFVLFAVGTCLLLLSILKVATELSSPLLWGGVLVGAGYLLILVANVGEYQRRRRAPGGTSRPLPSASADDRDVQTAAIRLRQIWFQQSFSSGWSGGLKAPIGLEGGISGSTELAEQQLTFPEIVSMFKEFIEQVASGRQVRIGIDELDKMDDETARCFLNEIKVVFRVPGCFFFVSISEDAMSYFERRGLPFRDVFDSSFDDIVYVPHLSFEVSRELLDRRIVDLPLPFACLLHGISGGLPRDLIRSARDLVEMEKGTSLRLATAELTDDALRSKASATRVVARRFQAEDHATLLVGWLERLERAGGDSEALLSACREFEQAFLDRLADLPDQEDLRRERRELQGLGTQLVAFAYHAATMLEFFVRFDGPDYVDSAISTDAEGLETPSLVDRLANVTQAFSADLNTVWEMLSRLRTDLGLDIVPFPKLHLRDSTGPSPVAGEPA
jgi:hypothetical protein